MKTQNNKLKKLIYVHIAIDRDLWKRVRIKAIQKNVSASKLICDTVEKIV